MQCSRKYEKCRFIQLPVYSILKLKPQEFQCSLTNINLMVRDVLHPSYFRVTRWHFKRLFCEIFLNISLWRQIFTLKQTRKCIPLYIKWNLSCCVGWLIYLTNWKLVKFHLYLKLGYCIFQTKGKQSTWNRSLYKIACIRPRIQKNLLK